MAPDSVDDSYTGCAVDMKETIYKTYLSKELNENEELKTLWKTNCANEMFKKKESVDKDLELDHFKALYAYTAESTLYSKFNNAVRTKGPEYTSGFSYHAMHFLLSDAIRVLKENQPTCVTTYRRTKLEFKGEVNTEMRFGFFASSSKKTDLTDFGDKTCFEIETCYGAYLKKYSCFGTDEEEVLIPPYEKFKITAIEHKGNVLQCNVLYKLKSSETKSNFNCKAVPEVPV